MLNQSDFAIKPTEPDNEPDNEPALVLFRWFWCGGASIEQQAEVLRKSDPEEHERMLEAMPDDRRAQVRALLNPPKKAQTR